MICLLSHKVEMLRCCFTLCCVLTLLGSTAQARVGESRAAIEGRLLGSGGVVYRDDHIERSRMRGKPYAHLLPYLEGAEVRIYFKTADGRAPSSSQLNAKRMNAGWDLHVVYLNGKSVIELYERSRAMTEFESNQLLAMQAGESYWRRVTKEEKKPPSALGYEMERADTFVRARKMGGNILLFVNAEIDSLLALKKKEDQLEKAPQSVQGF